MKEVKEIIRILNEKTEYANKSGLPKNKAE
jgi:hypothetical protein